MSTDVRSMFDKEVIEEMRRQFNEADKDGSGQLDAKEACDLFARRFAALGQTEEEIKKVADGLRNQMDADRSSTISFDEYCFRFGRRYQMELARKRRQNADATTSRFSNDRTGAEPAAAAADDEAARLRREREALEREKEELRREREAVKRERKCKEFFEEQGLTVGARVTLQNLQATPELNGRSARILRFDESSGRFIVELDNGGGQKSLRPESLVQIPDGSNVGTGASFLDGVKKWLREASAQVTVWLAGYEWWQIALGVAVVALIVGAYLQNSARYSKAARRSGAAYNERSRSSSMGADGELGSRSFQSDERRGGHGGRYDRYGYDGFDDVTDHDPYHQEHHNSYGGYSSGGLLSGMDQTTTLFILVGIGFLCWKGIIPVHRMSWFQIYMLWNMVQPLLFGGRGGGGGYRSRRRYW